jgi:hypothetical protein
MPNEILAPFSGNGSWGNKVFSSSLNVTTSDGFDDPQFSGTAGSFTGTTSVALTAVYGYPIRCLIHQTQSSGGNVGLWEEIYVINISGTTVTFASPLKNTYTFNGNVEGAQIIAAPMYENLTVNTSQQISSKSIWRSGNVGTGSAPKGGIMYLVARNTITLNGSVAQEGYGFRGWPGLNGTQQGRQGEGHTGAPGGQNTANAGNGGGGGGYSNNGPWNQGNGGGGASNYGTGQGGIGTGGGNNSNGGGGSAGAATNFSSGGNNMDHLFLGGAGGEGGVEGGSNVSGAGGAGGGGVFVVCRKLIIPSTGRIGAHGLSGGGNRPFHAASGGSGAGGFIYIRALEVDIANAGRLTANGQPRVYNNGSSPGDADGGASGDGIIVIETGKFTNYVPQSSDGYGHVDVVLGGNKWLGRLGAQG